MAHERNKDNALEGEKTAISPEDIFLKGEFEAQVQNGREALSEEESQVIGLYYGLGEWPAMNYKEIGSRLGISESTAQSTKIRGIKKLRKYAYDRGLRTYFAEISFG